MNLWKQVLITYDFWWPWHLSVTLYFDLIKGYLLCLQEMLYRGRIRIQIKNDDGTPVKSEFPSRESVMKYIGESIPKLKTRQNR